MSSVSTRWHASRNSAFYNESLLTQFQRDRIDVILVSPRNPLNIGAVARAMANFGFEQLSVIAPYEPHWREAKSAIGAQDLLQNSKTWERLEEAVADCTLVIGTGTLTHRKAEQKVVILPALAPLIEQELERGGRIAIIFGPEKHGLTREDLSYCHVLVEIPTDTRQPSMNLGQAVAVCLYELATRALSPADRNDAAQDQPARRHPVPSTPSASLDRLADVIEEAMTEAGYSPRIMHAANRHDLQLLLRRLQLNVVDTRRAMGLFRRIVWRLKHINR